MQHFQTFCSSVNIKYFTKIDMSYGVAAHESNMARLLQPDTSIVEVMTFLVMYCFVQFFKLTLQQDLENCYLF